jgi:hypothetical protein
MKGSPVGIKDALETEDPTNLQANPLKSQMRLPCVKEECMGYTIFTSLFLPE